MEICLSLSNNICEQIKPDRTPTADVFDSDKRVVLLTARDASWQDPLKRLELSATPQSEQPEAQRARIVAHHCIHPSRVRSGLRMTRNGTC